MSQYSSLIGVGFGAILASLGGFLANRIAANLEQRRRARFAALVCAEVLMALEYLSKQIADAHGRGDPFGNLTARLIRSARREVELYERNREMIFELGNEELRSRIHSLMLRLAIPLDHILDEVARQLTPVIIGGSHSNDTRLSRGADEAYETFLQSCDMIDSMLLELYPRSHNLYERHRHNVASRKTSSNLSRSMG